MIYITKAPYIQGIPGGGLQHRALNLKISNPRRAIPHDTYHASRCVRKQEDKESQAENISWVLLWFLFLIVVFVHAPTPPL